MRPIAPGNPVTFFYGERIYFGFVRGHLGGDGPAVVVRVLWHDRKHSFHFGVSAYGIETAAWALPEEENVWWVRGHVGPDVDALKAVAVLVSRPLVGTSRRK